MSGDRTVRRLTALEKSASTSRVLNLVSVQRHAAEDPAIVQAPFFNNRFLNNSIILKHRVRPHEMSMLARPKGTVTKLLSPIDGTDLKLGARFLMVGQRGFDDSAEELFGDALKPGQRDRQVLDLLDELPSLDPFLLREHLKRHGHQPARAYFAITDADMARMFEFVRREITDLVTLSQGDTAASHTQRMVEKLLSSSPEAGFEPLKETLKLSDREYLDGIFSWRGFLYYKWLLTDLKPQVKDIIAEIQSVRPRGPADADTTAYLGEARRRLTSAVVGVGAQVSDTLSTYDKAYRALTKEGKPLSFREFLLEAPEMFQGLGERLGAMQHVCSFWCYRFPQGKRQTIAPDELMDVFLDFEDSLVVEGADVRLSA